jgi:hypothetical protein
MASGTAAPAQAGLPTPPDWVEGIDKNPVMPPPEENCGKISCSVRCFKMQFAGTNGCHTMFPGDDIIDTEARKACLKTWQTLGDACNTACKICPNP